jgi:hypothetical protein
VPERILAEDADLAPGRPQEAQQQADRGGLAGAVGAQEPEGFAFGDGEGDVLHATALAVELGEAGSLDDDAGQVTSP